jgi:hypothetical protein
VPGVFGTGEQSVDQPAVFVRRAVVEKGAGVGRSRDGAGEVERDAAEEFVVGRDRGGGFGELGVRGDEFVDSLAQRLLGAGVRAQARQQRGRNDVQVNALGHARSSVS